MTGLELGIILVAALVAGAVNGAVGSGSLVTLPVLLWIGLDPATAITTNTIAMVFSATGGVIAYRKELVTQRQFIRQLWWVSVSGGVAGALLLITTTPGAIRVLVPVLIVVALLLVVFQPWVSGWVRAQRTRHQRLVDVDSTGATSAYDASPGLKTAIAATAVYGGYFAAAQGVMLLGILGASTGKPMREVNGVKNLLTMTVNITAAVVFTVAYFIGFVDVIWAAVAVMAFGAFVGGYGGGRVAQAVPDVLLRGMIVAVALASLANEFLR